MYHLVVAQMPDEPDTKDALTFTVPAKPYLFMRLAVADCYLADTALPVALVYRPTQIAVRTFNTCPR